MPVINVTMALPISDGWEIPDIEMEAHVNARHEVEDITVYAYNSKAKRMGEVALTPDNWLYAQALAACEKAVAEDGEEIDRQAQQDAEYDRIDRWRADADDRALGY